MFYLSLALIVALTACILMGHNSHFITALIAINGLVFGKTGYDKIKGDLHGKSKSSIQDPDDKET